MAGDPIYFYFGTEDAGKAKSFFGDVLGWETGPGNAEDGHQITNINPPGGFFGGEGMEPGQFRMYFQVDALEAAMDRIRELGGTTGEPQPTSGGRFADCTDDQGMNFGIWAAEG